MSEEQIVNLKQRIVGAIVLVSLGVIILPLLLNGGTHLDRGISRTNIPPKPKVLNKPLPKIPVIKKMPEAQPISNKPLLHSAKDIIVEVNQPVQKTKITPPKYKKMSKPSSAKVDTAYTLQLASFSKKSNAITLRDKLRKKGFKAYAESIRTSKGKVYRLRVGPYLNYEQISSAQKKIEKAFKLKNSVIIKYKT